MTVAHTTNHFRCVVGWGVVRVTRGSYGDRVMVCVAPKGVCGFMSEMFSWPAFDNLTLWYVRGSSSGLYFVKIPAATMVGSGTRFWILVQCVTVRRSALAEFGTQSLTLSSLVLICISMPMAFMHRCVLDGGRPSAPKMSAVEALAAQSHERQRLRPFSEQTRRALSTTSLYPLPACRGDHVVHGEGSGWHTAEKIVGIGACVFFFCTRKVVNPQRPH